MSGKDVEIFYKQAMSYLGQGEIDKGIEFFDKALEVEDWYLPAWNDKGVALLEKKEYEAALKCFEKVVLLDPVSSMPLYNKGYVQLILENYTDSILTFESFLERYQNKDDFYKYALYLKGQAHYNLKQYEKAHRSLEEAILHDKTFKEARELIIKVLNKKNNIK